MNIQDQESFIQTPLIQKNEFELKQTESKQQQGFFSMFRFADKTDRILIAVGTIAAILNGAGIPFFSILWAKIYAPFGLNDINLIIQATRSVIFNFLEIGLLVFITSWIMYVAWTVTGERQTTKCKKQYLKALLSQEIGWFDVNKQTQLTSKFQSDTMAFQQCIGEKIPTLIATISNLFVALIIMFSFGWLLSLIMICTLPFIVLSGYFYGKMTKKKFKVLQDSFNEANGKAYEAISAIKTVKSLNGEQHQVNIFRKLINQNNIKVKRFLMVASCGLSTILFVNLASYGLGYWFGAKFIEQQRHAYQEIYTQPIVLIIIYTYLYSSSNFNNLSPAFKKINEGVEASGRIFSLIDRKPQITAKAGIIIKEESLKGVIKFNNVSFAYPKQPDKMVLKNATFEIAEKSNIAIVGHSGCGKSTIIQLIMRFYDPTSGSITLDGIDIKNYNLLSLRKAIGFVGQEPALFNTTIRNNILLAKHQASQVQVVSSLQSSEAYTFIQQLDAGIDTYVGLGGGKFSGGQKQRIAIARALIRKPKILLLDEATSALDQTLIEKIFERLAKDTTIISVAHRTSTIKNSKLIMMIEDHTVKQICDFRRYSELHKLETSPGQKQELQTQIGSTYQTEKEDFLSECESFEGQNLRPSRIAHQQNIYTRLFNYNREDLYVYIAGIVVTLLFGTIRPIYSIVYTKMNQILANIQSTKNTSSYNYYCSMFLVLAVCSFVLDYFKHYIFGVTSQNLTNRIRVDCYSKILKMPIKWFDSEKHSITEVNRNLAVDCNTLNGLTGNYINLISENISTILTGLVIGFYFEWRIGLLTLLFIPFIFGGIFIQLLVMIKLNKEYSDICQESTRDMAEAITNIRTVYSLSSQQYIMNKFDKDLDKVYNFSVKKGNYAGILNGVSLLASYVVGAVALFVTTLVVKAFSLDYINSFISGNAIMFAAMIIGFNTQFVHEISVGKNAAIKIFQILDGEDEDMKQVEKAAASNIRGVIQFRNVSFTYPSRNKKVLDNLSFKIEKGQKIGIVGNSGCGKSTVIQLLLRFYQPDSGQILLDGQNIENYDVHELRNSIGLVSQEPVLFSTSIKQNIQYNLETVSQLEIKQAAKLSNSLHFIEEDSINPDNNTLTKGFDRNVGLKGGHISGGQKQRIAIARAILRKYQVLLLDEATSALDNNNEKIVQNALDILSENRTTITVAHRINTIRYCDNIIMLNEGRIAQQGNYNELIARKGSFYYFEKGRNQ